MADAPAPPAAMAPLLAGGAARPPPAAVAAQLRALVTHARSHHQATRRFLVERAKDAVAVVTRSLAELHEISTMVGDTAAVVPGLHEFADVLREFDTRSHAVLDELKTRWNAAADAAASADAEQADVAQGAGRAAPPPAQAVPHENDARREPVPAIAAPRPQPVDRAAVAPVRLPPRPQPADRATVAPVPPPPRPRPATPATPEPEAGPARPRKRPRPDDDSNLAHRRRTHSRTRSGSSNSDDDDANTVGGGGGGTPRAHGRVPVRPIDAAVLAQLALTDLGQLLTSDYEIAQDPNDTVPLREMRTALGRNYRNGRLPWDKDFLESVGVTKDRVRFCTSCGHAPYTVRTRCCEGWTRGKSGVLEGVVVFGVRQRRQGAGMDAQIPPA